MEAILAQLIGPLFVNNGPPGMFPPGIAAWSDTGVLLIWCVLLAFIGSMLALMREGVAGHFPREARRNVRSPRRRPAHTRPTPARLAYAHPAHVHQR